MQASEIDIECRFPPQQSAAALRRTADALEYGSNFRLQVAGSGLSVPHGARVEIERQSGGDGSGEIEIELKSDRSDRQTPRGGEN